MEAGEGEEVGRGGGEDLAGGEIGVEEEEETITEEGEEELFGEGAEALGSIIKMLGKFKVRVGRCVSMGVREGDVEGGIRALSSSSCCWPPSRLSCTWRHLSVRTTAVEDVDEADDTGGGVRDHRKLPR